MLDKYRVSFTEGRTFLESSLPFRELSLLAVANRRSRDPAYSAHRWWARRPPSVVRGLLIAAALPEDSNEKTYWDIFNNEAAFLEGVSVFDPFSGGGSTLIEASRLGASVFGSDVDPLAVEIARHALRPPDEVTFTDVTDELIAAVTAVSRRYYPKPFKEWTPLHYFFLHSVSCPDCGESSLLYRDLIIARDSRRHGAVRRDSPLITFCPDCLDIHNLSKCDRSYFSCCNRRWQIDVGNFSSTKFECPYCLVRSSHRDLQTGQSPRQLIAVEETNHILRRRIRAPVPADLRAISLAKSYLANNRKRLFIPKGEINVSGHDTRPVSYGIRKVEKLFTERQLVVFGTAFRWLRAANLNTAVSRATWLALSNALTSNNRLCGYARDYGRLSPLFGVRGYALPTLAVELNPLHPSAGRGTLHASSRRVLRSIPNEVTRFFWCQKRRRPVKKTLKLERNRSVSRIRCRSASHAGIFPNCPVDILFFDPPYFDNISYSTLSQLNRSWLRKSSLAGAPLLPKGTRPTDTFANNFAKCLKESMRSLRLGRPLAFTFHSALAEAWQAVGIALDESELMITAMWPLLNDVAMGHLGRLDNCEWDVVIVCRPNAECTSSKVAFSLNKWQRHVAPLEIKSVDTRNLAMAIKIASERFGKPIIPYESVA